MGTYNVTRRRTRLGQILKEVLTIKKKPSKVSTTRARAIL